MSEIIPDDFWEPFCKSVGYVAVNWALAESPLDALVVIAFENLGGNKLGLERPRTAVAAKIKFLRKCLNKLPELSPYANELRDLLSRVKKLSKLRNTVIHGALSAYDPKTLTIKFVSIKGEENFFKTTEDHITLAELLAIGNDSMSLSSDLLNLAKRLLDELLP